MTRYIAPNQEPEMVLACGCIETSAFAFKRLGLAGEFQICPREHEGNGPYGTVKILRKASLYEIIRWRVSGTPAPKRPSRKAPQWMQALSGKPEKETDTKPRREPDRLF